MSVGGDEGITHALESATIRGAHLVYRRSGNGHHNAVVMLHGLASDHTGLRDLAAHLRHAQIIALDLPGFGRSEPLPGRHTLTSYVEVVEELRQHLGLARFVLLGHSLGGAIALAYAVRYPAALDALCLLNPTVEAGSPTARLSQFYYDQSIRLPAALGRLLLISRPAVYLSDRALFTTRDRPTRRRILRQDYATARLAVPRAVQESYLSLTRTPFERFADQIITRTLLVTGRHDPLSTPRSLTRLHRRMAHSRLQIVADAGHLLPVEHCADAAALIERFLLDTRVIYPTYR